VPLSCQEARRTGGHCRESGDDVVEVANPVVAADVQDQPQEEHEGDRQCASRCYKFHAAPLYYRHFLFIGKAVQFLELIGEFDPLDWMPDLR
jgi:predicted phosphoribosyltransferase